MTDPLIIAATGLSTATVHEAAGRTGALPSAIKPLSAETWLCGRAFPVRSPAGDNLAIHHGLYAARAGDVLVIDCGDAEYGYWGEVMACAAQSVGIAGLVISGGVRDTRQMVAMGFAVFAGNVCVRGTGKDPAGEGTIGTPVTIGDILVSAGDLVIGDADGVAVIEASKADAVIREARARDRDELELLARLRNGATTLELFGLPDLGAR